MSTNHKLNSLSARSQWLNHTEKLFFRALLIMLQLKMYIIIYCSRRVLMPICWGYIFPFISKLAANCNELFWFKVQWIRISLFSFFVYRHILHNCVLIAKYTQQTYLNQLTTKDREATTKIPKLKPLEIQYRCKLYGFNHS